MQSTSQAVKLLKRHSQNKEKKNLSLTSIFAQVSCALLPLFLAFLCTPELPCRNDKSKNVCFKSGIITSRYYTKKSMSQGGCKMFEFANYILYFLCVFQHFMLTLMFSTPVCYGFLQGLSLLLEAFP